jgi:tetratricopeptide (TPR) repeat protein
LIAAIAALLAHMHERRALKIPAMIAMIAIGSFFAVRTWIRAGDWKNNFTLAASILKVSPSSPRANNMMGLELRRMNRNKEALDYFEKAVASNPNHVPALVNLGTEYKNFNRLEEAAATLEEALRVDPSILATYVNLMSIYRSKEEYDKNLVVAQKAVERFPNSAAVLWNAANAYHLKNEMIMAEQLRARAREIQPDIGK